MNDNQKQLLRNVELTQIAREHFAFIDLELDQQGLSQAEKSQVWKRIKDQALGTDPPSNPKSSYEPMSYEEAKKWYHNHRIDFGKHTGKTIEEIPFDYLEWLADQPDFRRDLIRFMESDYVKSNIIFLRRSSQDDD